MPLALAVVGAVVYLGTLFLLPETIHACRNKVADDNGERRHGSRLPLALLNPFASLVLLRSPNLFLVVSNWVHPHLIGGVIDEIPVPCGCCYIGLDLR